MYWYNAAIDGIDQNIKPQNISKVFGPMPGTTNPAIPGYIDAVLFDKRDGNLYFFKGDKVSIERCNDYDVNYSGTPLLKGTRETSKFYIL